jgi:hypothetical protein
MTQRALRNAVARLDPAVRDDLLPRYRSLRSAT